MQLTSSPSDYWNRVASQKQFSHPLRQDWLAQYLKNRRARILDHGCGYGRSMAELSRAGFQNLVGVDFSAAMLARAQTEAPVSRLVRNDGQSLPFKNECFDAVLIFAVLTCIPRSDDQRRLMAEIKRVLRPGGLLYVSDLLVNTDERNRERYQSSVEKHQCYGVFELPEGVVVRHHTKEWIEELTRAFRQVEYDAFTVTTMNGNHSAAFQYLGLNGG